MLASISACEKKIVSLKEEMQSVKHNGELLAGKAAADDNSKKTLEQNKQQIEDLIKSISVEETKINTFKKIKERALIANTNAKQVANTTYEIGSHMSSFTAGGIKRITAPFQGYLLGRYVMFVPVMNPVDEEALYGKFGTDSSAGYAGESSHWIERDFKVTRQTDQSVFVENTPIAEFLKQKMKKTSIKPLYVIMSSSELKRSRTPSLFATRETIFDNAGILKGQGCYFAPQSIYSGASPTVAWSVLMRDLCRSYADGGGRLLNSTRSRWCLDIGMDELSCPALAVEIQVRTPIPKVEGAVPGSYLQDPEGGQPVPLYPPLPPELI
jgi:hypothetical protein